MQVQVLFPALNPHNDLQRFAQPCQRLGVLRLPDFYHTLHPLEYAIGNVRFVQGEIVLPHGLGRATERNRGVGFGHAGHPGAAHCGASQVVEFEVSHAGLVEGRLGLIL